MFSTLAEISSERETERGVSKDLKYFSSFGLSVESSGMSLENKDSPEFTRTALAHHLQGFH